MLLDTHFHLDFFRDVTYQQEFVASLENLGAGVVAQTVRPSDYPRRVVSRWSSLGFHPWFIDENKVERELEIFSDSLTTTRYVGEVGLDFSSRGLTRAKPELQTEVFRRIVVSCSQAAKQFNVPFVLSIHSVKSASTVLDILEQDGGAADGLLIPVFHWFSDGGLELNRLLKMGCYVSINHRMLETKRGRAYAQQVPATQLLLETDLPVDNQDVLNRSAEQSAREHVELMQETLNLISTIRGDNILPQIVQNQEKIYIEFSGEHNELGANITSG